MDKFIIRKNKNVNQRITLRVTDELREKIFTIAQQNDISVNNLIINCIEFAFENIEK